MSGIILEKIGLYIGSFDPIHKGHYEVICTMLKYVNKIAILPNNPNRHKPNRSSLLDRLNIIKLTLHDFIHINKVIIVEENCDEYIKNIVNSKKYWFVGIMGSDSYNILAGKSQQPKYYADEWYIIPRIDHDSIKLAIWSKPVTFLPTNKFMFQNSSSSSIRNKIYNELNPIEINEIISIDIFKYIKYQNLYPTKTNVIELIKNNIDIEIEKLSFIKDNVVSINNKFVAKIFFDKLEFEKEIAANNIMKNVPVIDVPKILKTFNEVGGKYFIILFEYVGKLAYELVKSGHDGYRIGYSIGMMLFKLHNHVKTNMTKDMLDKNKKMVNLRKVLYPTHIQDLYDNLGVLTLTHGDCSIDNFVVDDSKINLLQFDDYKTYMIDLSRVSDSYIDEKTAIGIPEYDYYQFISSVHWKIADEVIKRDVIKGFKFGYSQDSKNNVYYQFACCEYWQSRCAFRL